jgi:hypothetical protein
MNVSLTPVIRFTLEADGDLESISLYTWRIGGGAGGDLRGGDCEDTRIALRAPTESERR